LAAIPAVTENAAALISDARIHRGELAKDPGHSEELPGIGETHGPSICRNPENLRLLVWLQKHAQNSGPAADILHFAIFGAKKWRFLWSNFTKRHVPGDVEKLAAGKASCGMFSGLWLPKRAEL